MPQVKVTLIIFISLTESISKPEDSIQSMSHNLLAMKYVVLEEISDTYFSNLRNNVFHEVTSNLISKFFYNSDIIITFSDSDQNQKIINDLSIKPHIDKKSSKFYAD